MILRKLTEYQFDFELAKEAAFKILAEHNFISQIGLTHSTKEMTEHEKILESTGSIFDRESKKFKFRETDFSVFNERYKDTYLYEMYKAIPNIGRFRIMTMDGPSCYTLHRDLTQRYHYVLQTNPDCLFLFPGKYSQFNIPADGHLYMVNTLFRHTFVNASNMRRIHLILDDISTLTAPISV